MKAKVETEEQRRKRKQKEERELRKWEREAAKPKKKYYLFYVLFILSLVQCIDNISTAINTQMQSEIAISLFADRLSIMNLLSMLSMPLVLCSIFYKALADRYGRKLFLCLNTLGMSVGLFVIFLAGEIGALPGMVMYLAATSFITFFIANDTQVLFIMETAHPEKRAQTFSIINGIGALSVVLIPMMRHIFMGDDITRWNYVYVVPGIVGLVISFVCLLFARESEVFLENRISYLRMTDEERRIKAEREGKKEEELKSQGGVGKAMKYALGQKQLRYLFLCVFFFGLSAFGANYYEKIASLHYETAEVTLALACYPFTAAAVTVINGFIGDKSGRRRSAIAMCTVCLVGFSLFYLSCMFHWAPWIAGLMIGAYQGGIWGVTDIYSIMAGESAPTNMRASVMSASGIVNLVSKMMAMILPTVVLFLSGDNYDVLGLMCIFGVIPLLAVSLILLFTKVKDTKGTDLTEVV